ncbi:MAG: DUF1934 domain-containing protein [Acutalibacteraceae bacterium]
MTDNMNICVDGQQTCDTQSDRITLQTTGALFSKGNAWYITYSERDDEGGEIPVTLKLQPDRALMIRSGAARMEFCPGMDTVCDYRTSAGTLTLQVRTHAVIASLSPSGGSVELIYSLFAGQELLSKNDVQIILTPLA